MYQKSIEVAEFPEYNLLIHLVSERANELVNKDRYIKNWDIALKTASFKLCLEIVHYFLPSFL